MTEPALGLDISKPMGGFGRQLRITLGYARATWDMMVWAVGSLEGPPLFSKTLSKRSQAKVRQIMDKGKN